MLVAQGAGKLASPTAYFTALSRFQVIPDGAEPIVGWMWIALELGAGAILSRAALQREPARTPALAAAVVALALQLAYAALSTSAYARRLPIANCTCFGIYLPQHLSWFVLLQDAYMIFFASWQLYKIRRW